MMVFHVKGKILSSVRYNISVFNVFVMYNKGLYDKPGFENNSEMF